MTNKNNKANSDNIFEIPWHFRVHMLLPHGASFPILHTSFWMICLADHVYQPVSCWYCKIILFWHHFQNFRQRFFKVFPKTKKCPQTASEELKRCSDSVRRRWYHQEALEIIWERSTEQCRNIGHAIFVLVIHHSFRHRRIREIEPPYSKPIIIEF